MEFACALSDWLDHHRDPLGASERTEIAVRQLEALGAGVESDSSGEIFFIVDGLRGLYGGNSAGVVQAAERAVGEGWRIGLGCTRLGAFIHAGRWPQPVPVSALRRRLGISEREADEFVDALERLGITTLQALSRLPADKVADRFGPLGSRAQRICFGEEGPLRPRAPHEELVEEIELPEESAGLQLNRALELLVDRLLAAPRRKGRTILGLRFGARFASGGSWAIEQGLGQPTASARVLYSLLALRLGELPQPATALRLRAIGLGSVAIDQLDLVGGDRRDRLRAALRELGATQGSEALLKILPVDNESRVPERRAVLTPHPGL
ncbi:MAG TPA: hypothetical protein VFU11_05560 [Solirubrobacterales bacterium]|nr:hypothetical protein [Solirubrobacterales bacterium]